MPIDYKTYPANWKTEIRPAILKRAQNRCEWCNVENHAIGFRDDTGRFVTADEFGNGYGEFEFCRDVKLTKIVLTIAHIDHDVGNNNFANLAALCQRCRLLHDRKRHTHSARHNRDRKSGQWVLL